MFGINSLEQVGQIVEGWTNDFLGKEKELSEKRMSICKKCPLFDAKAIKCNNKKCYNKKTNEISTSPANGFICGCGCYLTKKTKAVKAKCPLGNW